MVRPAQLRVSLILLPLTLLAACGGQVPDGWRVIGVEDAMHPRMIRSILCGEKLEVGLVADHEALSTQNKKVIDAIPVERREMKASIVRPDARTLSSVFLMKGVRVAIDDKSASALKPLLSRDIADAQKPVAVILDLPMQAFPEHVTVLSKAISKDEATGLRLMATTGQVSVTLKKEILQRLVSLPSVCAVYPDATLAPIDDSIKVPSK
jgi:hypothetical protein